MHVLVVNAGSSSLKLRLLDDSDAVVGTADLAAGADGFDTGALADAIAGWPVPDVVGHRVVHGGTRFSGAVRITAEVERALHDLTALAPLHQPKSLAGLAAVRERLPDVPAVACFDTAFHSGMPAAATTYAVPAQWRERYGVRRFGFHGLSHAYASRRAAELVGAQPGDGLRVVSCHLGAGASVCAVRDGRSVDTTMGFTPLEGLAMATRSGTVDPGLVLWLAEHERIPPRELTDALEHRSGMLALAGTADMREVEQRADAGDERAVLARDVYVHRLVGAVGAMAAAAGGLDVLVFTGGIGEHSPGIRRLAAQRLRWSGITLDDAANDAVAGDADISASADGPGATVRTVVVAAREDVQIAAEVRALLAG
ncbi:acetate kinase [Jatrophihabitans endophyticus]|uniref:Acetate kinase n=1 Tax=Jatrophihabitans endophyticus TaxID=1206085 RepID=A0A1M5CIM3_9ACTN|nr:acetate/propionate family kinase [Jatrophihabitans endophyticus]SHF54604.1 acetate kinase [Jatrophihabitans endophyticus]